MPQNAKKLEMVRFLKRPHLLDNFKGFNFDSIEEYNEILRKFHTYKLYSPECNNKNLHKRISTRGLNYFYDLSLRAFNQVAFNNSLRTIISKGLFLKKSEMYDDSFCTLGIIEVAGSPYLSIYIPKFYLHVANKDTPPIEIRDSYFYIVGSSLYLFRKTLDTINTEFIHPHVSNNYGSFCLGQSPLTMSLLVLSETSSLNETDADIFWVNFYRTITQKTEKGDHHYNLDKLSTGPPTSMSVLKKALFRNKAFVENLESYLLFNISEDRVGIELNIESIKRDFYEECTVDNSNVYIHPPVPVSRSVSFNGTPIKKIKYVNMYTKSRVYYNNIDNLLMGIGIEIFERNKVNTIYDDNKEKFKQPDNSGEQSVGQNQVLEFQVL